MASSLSRNDSSAEEEGENEFTPTEASFDGCEASGNETNDERCSSSLDDGGQQHALTGRFNAILERMNVLETQQRKYEAITQVSVGKVLGLQVEQQNQMTLIDQLSNAPQQFASNANSDSAVIGDLQTKFTTFEEHQKKILDKLSMVDNFIGILKDRFGNDLLKAVQPDLRPMIAEKFSISLPNSWDSIGCHSNLEIFGNDCLMVQYLGNGNGSSSVFAKSAIPSSEFGIFYYEIKVENVKNSVSIGLGTKTMPLYKSVGNHLDSYAYESNGTFLVNGTSNIGKEKYTNGDVVGFGVNLITRRIITTKNGLRLDTAHLFLSPSSSSDHLLLFPCVTLSDCGDKIEANFSPNFLFDPDNAKVFSEFRVKSNFWDDSACHNDLAISGPNNTVVQYKGQDVNDSWPTVFAKHSILDSVVHPLNIFYFELKVNDCGYLSFGFAVKHLAPLDDGVRINIGSYTYEKHGNYWINGSRNSGNEEFCDGDTVGCGVNFANNQVFFTKNGRRIDATNNFVVSSSPSADLLFPVVSVFRPNDLVANFGPEFLFDLSSLC